MHEPPPTLDDGTALERVRALCRALPQVSERASHGRPAFFIAGRRSFVSFMDNHHHDGRLALWCAAPAGVQAAAVAADPQRYFVPPYVGHRGWLGVRLDRGLDWDEVAGAIEDAYAVVAPARLVEQAAALRSTRTAAPRARSGAPPGGRGTPRPRCRR